MSKSIKFFFAPFLLVGFIAIVWHRILFLTPIGEGGYLYFYYQNSYLKELGASISRGQFSDFFRYDFGAFLFFGTLGPIFRDNFLLYQIIIFFTLIILSTLFYFMVYELTGKKSAAFFGASIFGLNYNSIYEMFAFGSYANFFQRVFFLILLFPSFILFLKFINTKKIYYYFVSLILLVLSILLAHFNFFSVPFLWIYILCLILIKKMTFKKRALLFSMNLFYLMVAIFILYIPLILNLVSWLNNKENILEFIVKNVNAITVQFLRQLTLLSIPDFFIRQILPFFNMSYSAGIIYNHGIQYLYLPVFLIYFLTLVFLFKREKKLRPVIIASLIFLPIVFTLNLYMRGEDTISHLETGNRYAFIPSIGFATFWGIFLASIYDKSKIARITIYFLIVIWVSSQVFSVNRKLNEESVHNVATKKIMAYFKSTLHPKLKDDSIVFTPSLVGDWGSNYLNMFYGKKRTIFIPRMDPEIEWKTEGIRHSFKRSFDPKKDFIIYYDYNSKEVVDVTKNYKNIIINR